MYNFEQSSVGKLLVKGITKSTRLSTLFLGVKDASGEVVKEAVLPLTQEVTTLSFAGAAFGMLTGILTIWQGWRQYHNGNKAAGIATMAAGSVIFVSSLLPLLIDTAAIPFFGWICLIVIGICFAASWYLYTPPIEKLLKKCVFGKEYDPDCDYGFLGSQPQEAYKQLLSMFIQLKMDTYSVSTQLRIETIKAVEKLEALKKGNHEKNQDKTKYLFDSFQVSHKENKQIFTLKKLNEYKKQGITHIVKLTTNACSMLNCKPEDFIVRYKFQETEVQETRGAGYSRTHLSPKPIKPFNTIDADDGKIFLFKSSISSKPPKGRIYYKSIIEALAQIEVGEIIFPQPQLDDVLDTQKLLLKGKIKKADINSVNFDGEYKNPYWLYSESEAM